MIIEVVGALGVVSRKFEKWFKKLDINVSVPLLQKAYLLGTGKILKKVLDVSYKKDTSW